MNIKLDGSKYEILADEKDGFNNFRALRHGEKWRDLTGDNLIYWLCQEIEALKKTCNSELAVMNRSSRSTRPPQKDALPLSGGGRLGE